MTPCYDDLHRHLHLGRTNVTHITVFHRHPLLQAGGMYKFHGACTLTGREQLTTVTCLPANATCLRMTCFHICICFIYSPKSVSIFLFKKQTVCYAYVPHLVQRVDADLLGVASVSNGHPALFAAPDCEGQERSRGVYESRLGTAPGRFNRPFVC